MPKRILHRKIYKRKKRYLRIILKFFGLFFLILFILTTALFIYFIKDLPRPEKFTEGNIAQSSKIYDRTGKILLYEIAGEEKRTFVALEKIPNYLKWAVVSTEDASFYKHKGLDFKALSRAVLYDLKLGKFVQGGSTISQQLIRSYFLTRKKTLTRKTREIVLTLELERRYSKDQILEWYLNLIPFGGILYGVEAASQAFFNKHISDVSLAESAVLAAIIQAPSYFSPYGPNTEELHLRKNYILNRMKQEGYITEEEKEEAEKEDIKFLPNITEMKAPHFVMYVKQYLIEKYGEEFLFQRGLKIQTTLDFNLQEKAQKIVKNGVEAIKGYDAYNGGLVALNPKTGEILAMVGSKAGSEDYFSASFPEGCTPPDCLFDPQVNTTVALRQPGSAFKPFVYATLFKKGFTPNTILWDVKTEFNANCDSGANEDYDKYNQKCYHPKNYDGRYLGPINLRSSLAQSRNLPSVKVLYLAGVAETLELAESFGIQTLKDPNRYGLSLVLGGGEVKLLEIVGAFSVFANDGIKTSLHFIKKIEDANGNIIEEEKQKQIKIISSQVAREINDILSDNEARSPMFGSNSVLYFKDYNVAAKTGTTQFLNDAWAIGYTPSIVVGVWVGNNNNSPMTKPGVVLAGPIWRKFMEEALPKFPKENFEEPKERITKIPILDGELLEFHSILHYVNKENPLEELKTPSSDSQYQNWEEGIKNHLNQ